ncbi:MAG: hypothetical protein IJT16_08255 [Lachnospiraceae bacterium]|nr:hypothetical protein [Lachnospiraceae bacterium]
MGYEEDNAIRIERDDFVKHTVRDSVFGDLFRNKKYLRQLYQALHPEDNTVTEDDFTDVTIRNVFVNELYNDLGCMVRGKLIILCECQSRWTLNIIIRALLYMARSYQLYFQEQGTDLYGTRKVFLPKPELYVIYIGDEQNRPTEISLAEEFFDGAEAAIDVKVKVVCESDGTDIINQYIVFSKVYGEQQKKYGRTRKAILEAIKICKDRNILKEYLESREKEVVDIMLALFDEQEVYETHFKSLEREFEEKGWKKGLKEGHAEGVKEGREEGREEGWEEGRAEGVKEGRKEGLKEGRKEGQIENTIDIYKEIGQSKESTIERLMRKFGLSPDEAQRKVNMLW